MSNSKTKHTPGPWTVLNMDDQGCYRIKEGTDHEIRVGMKGSEVADANRALIAAAPELLSLLERINTAFYTRTTRKEWIELMSESKPLLQRARGES
jgi:hypothetical protein